MATLRDADSHLAEDRRWDQCMRMLMTLSMTELREMQTTVATSIHNLLQHPSEFQYSRLRYSNKRLQSQVLTILCFGFTVEISPADGEKYLVYPMLTLMTSSTIHADILQTGLRWLERTIAVMESLVTLKSESSSVAIHCTLPAQTLIQLVFPTQQTALGGFLLGEKLETIYSFACSFYTATTSSRDNPRLTLHLPHDRKHNLCDFLSDTIEMHADILAPRARILAVSDAKGDEERVDETAQRVQDEEKEKHRQQHTRRQEKERQKEDEQKRRRQVLDAFREDRERRNRMPPPLTGEEGDREEDEDNTSRS